MAVAPLLPDAVPTADVSAPPTPSAAPVAPAKPTLPPASAPAAAAVPLPDAEAMAAATEAPAAVAFATPLAAAALATVEAPPAIAAPVPVALPAAPVGPPVTAAFNSMASPVLVQPASVLPTMVSARARIGRRVVAADGNVESRRHDHAVGRRSRRETEAVGTVRHAALAAARTRWRRRIIAGVAEGPNLDGVVARVLGARHVERHGCGCTDRGDPNL
jgi:hypothetical protein